jgi:hypothetical protein
VTTTLEVDVSNAKKDSKNRRTSEIDLPVQLVGCWPSRQVYEQCKAIGSCIVQRLRIGSAFSEAQGSEQDARLDSGNGHDSEVEKLVRSLRVMVASKPPVNHVKRRCIREAMRS